MSAGFELTTTPLAGLVRIEREIAVDERGFLSRLFCAQEYESVGFTQPIAQINRTLTKLKGTIRGMHFQYPPFAEDKLVTCIRGEVFDVAIDIRKGSPTLLDWHAEVLSSTDQKSLFIPKGFAHGFQTLTDNCELLYFHSNYYSPEHEGGLNALDPVFSIEWTLEPTGISDRDKSHPVLDTPFKGIDF